MDITKGLVVRSAAGHDKGKFFVVIGVTGIYASISDGKHRPINKTKKKKVKHLRLTNTILSEESMKTDRMIRMSLRKFDDGNLAEHSG